MIEVGSGVARIGVRRGLMNWLVKVPSAFCDTKCIAPARCNVLLGGVFVRCGVFCLIMPRFHL